MTVAELVAIAKQENKISVLLEMGWVVWSKVEENEKVD